MIDYSRIIAILAVILQVGNLALGFLNVYAPEWAFLVGAILAGLQAFTRQIQGENG